MSDLPCDCGLRMADACDCRPGMANALHGIATPKPAEQINAEWRQFLREKMGQRPQSD